MQNKFKECGITATTNDKKLIIEIPIKPIIDKYNNNIDGCDNRIKTKYKEDIFLMYLNGDTKMDKVNINLEEVYY